MSGVVGLFLLVWIVGIVGLIAALVSLFRRSDEDVAGGSRVLWALVILFLPLAWVVYFLIGRRDPNRWGP
jgi:hypothetical protein